VSKPSPSSLAPTLRVVRVNASCPDEAIDVAAMDGNLARYITTRDPDLLKFRDGATPVWFTVRRLPASFFRILDREAYPVARNQLAFRAAVHTVNDGTNPIETVPARDAKLEDRFGCTKGDGGVDLAPETWLDEVCDRWGVETVHEMGQVAIDFSRLPKAARGPFSLWLGTVATS
jgi:hypothetical protein